MTRTFILLAALTALFLLIGQLLGGRTGFMFALLFAFVMNVGAYWYSDKLVLKMYKAREVRSHDAPALYGIVQQLAQRAKMPMPKVYIVPSQTPNAFATGRNPNNAAVAATEGILRLLNKEELTGVMAHELSHVANRDTLISTITATLAGAIAMLASIAKWGALLGRQRQGQGNIFAILAVAIFAPMAAGLIQFAVSRTREYAADKRGAQLCGDPLWLASALQKLEQGNQQKPMQTAEAHPESAHMFIVNPLKPSKVAHLFSTHPPMADRVRRLQAMANNRPHHN